jgi:hypothetical protein
MEGVLRRAMDGWLLPIRKPQQLELTHTLNTGK